MKKLSFWFITFILAILAFGVGIYIQPRTVASSFVTEQPTIVAVAATPTITPVPVTPTPQEWRFPDRAQIGTVVIGNMTEAEAHEALNQAYRNSTVPLTLVASGHTDIVKSSDFDYGPTIDQSLIEARELAEKGIPIRLALPVKYNSAELSDVVHDFNAQITLSPTLDFDSQMHEFVITDGLTLDEDAALEQIKQTLELSPSLRRIELPTQPLTNTQLPTSEQVIAAIQAREAEWDGMVAVAVYDLKNDEFYNYNGDVVFSGMSVMKIPILLQAYISRAEFTPEQQEAIRLMIDISDNYASNDLLAMIGDGDGLEGVKKLNALLKDVIGTEHTFLAAPYESIEYLAMIGVYIPEKGPEGPEPRTDADPYVRTTPNEMVLVMKAIVNCANGRGALLKIEDSALTPKRCQEILDILTTNEDINKIVAGVPEGSYVAHKSGWIDDARADAGYVRTPTGAEYIASIWMWDDTDFIETPVSDPLLADLSRIIYTAQFPVHR